MSLMGKVLKRLEDGKIAVRYNFWSGPHTLEVALHTKTDYEKSCTLFDDEGLVPECDSVICISDDRKLLFLF